MTNSIIIEKTIYTVQKCYSDCSFVNSVSSWKTFMSQAFGAIRLATVLVSDEEYPELEILWDEYKPKFEALIYGE